MLTGRENYIYKRCKDELCRITLSRKEVDHILHELSEDNENNRLIRVPSNTEYSEPSY